MYLVLVAAVDDGNVRQQTPMFLMEGNELKEHLVNIPPQLTFFEESIYVLAAAVDEWALVVLYY